MQDPESLERQNDAGISGIGERVAMLKGLTRSLHTEAESQNQFLTGVVRCAACHSIKYAAFHHATKSITWLRAKYKHFRALP